MQNQQLLNEDDYRQINQQTYFSGSLGFEDDYINEEPQLKQEQVNQLPGNMHHRGHNTQDVLIQSQHNIQLQQNNFEFPNGSQMQPISYQQKIGYGIESTNVQGSQSDNTSDIFYSEGAQDFSKQKNYQNENFKCNVDNIQQVISFQQQQQQQQYFILQNQQKEVNQSIQIQQHISQKNNVQIEITQLTYIKKRIKKQQRKIIKTQQKAPKISWKTTSKQAIPKIPKVINANIKTSQRARRAKEQKSKKKIWYIKNQYYCWRAYYNGDVILIREDDDEKEFDLIEKAKRNLDLSAELLGVKRKTLDDYGGIFKFTEEHQGLVKLKQFIDKNENIGKLRKRVKELKEEIKKKNDKKDQEKLVKQNEQGQNNNNQIQINSKRIEQKPLNHSILKQINPKYKQIQSISETIKVEPEYYKIEQNQKSDEQTSICFESIIEGDPQSQYEVNSNNQDQNYNENIQLCQESGDNYQKENEIKLENQLLNNQSQLQNIQQNQLSEEQQIFLF